MRSRVSILASDTGLTFFTCHLFSPVNESAQGLTHCDLIKMSIKVA